MFNRSRLRQLLTPAVMCVALFPGTSGADEVRPAVVELFTSQGCSSCPPAEAVLGELAARADVLALAYHVDYWDDIGWRDSFSSAAATRRQQQYARALRQGGIFTPQVVVDGQTSLIGSHRGSVLQAVKEPRRGLSLDVAFRNDSLVVSLPASGERTAYDVVAVAYLPEAATAIPRGENAGRTLREFNIVRSVHTLGKATGAAAQFMLPTAALARDARRVAILAQEPGTGRIIGATSAAIP